MPYLSLLVDSVQVCIDSSARSELLLLVYGIVHKVISGLHLFAVSRNLDPDKLLVDPSRISRQHLYGLKPSRLWDMGSFHAGRPPAWEQPMPVVV